MPHTLAPNGSVIGRLQRGLETLYRVDTHLDVEAFMVDEAARNDVLAKIDGANGTARRPREQLLVAHENDELHLALFLDADALANLEKHDPSHGLADANFQDFCLAVEGVSHFVYVAVCAAGDRSVSALELELQAEVDKFVTCLLMRDDHAKHAPQVRAKLFERPRYAPDLSHEERERYVTAHRAAERYAGSLHRRYLAHRRTPDMLAELRAFYRLGLDGKLGHIERAA
ncbi:MAG: hypothetical protein KA712_03080 [Myxococcales bacterium]|nr:hypothetical protein [Myxococcales bacterium]